MSDRILVTGGCGFLGHHFVEHILKNTDWEIVILDNLNYASMGYDRLRDIGVYDERRIERYAHDITKHASVGLKYELGDIRYVAHIAAETHVDNSIKDPRTFVHTNVVGTMEILELAREMPNLERFIYFSTDEIFGPAAQRPYSVEGWDDFSASHVYLYKEYREWDRYNCTNPYSATKAGAEELCLAYANTYGLPVIITHCMNLFGERQHPEKFIPLVIKKVLDGELVTIHADPTAQRPGSRFYLHARNASDAVLFLLSRAHQRRDKFNIVGDREVDNLALATTIAEIIGKPLLFELVDFHSSRPGHDLRYALNGDKLKLMGWTPPVEFESSLERTVRWFMDHPKWLES